jgi:hypothetical protein
MAAAINTAINTATNPRKTALTVLRKLAPDIRAVSFIAHLDGPFVLALKFSTHFFNLISVQSSNFRPRDSTACFQAK